MFIDSTRIGRTKNPEQIEQLFNPNRVFKREGDQKAIQILNEYVYQKQLNPEELEKIMLSIKSKVVVLQKGYNQTPREGWNKKYGLKVEESYNIEYFELLVNEKKIQ